MTILAKQRAGFENQVAEMRKLFDQITPEQRATLEEGGSRCATSSPRWRRASGATSSTRLLNEQRADQVRQRDDGR